MLRNLFSFFSMLALGVMAAAGLAALIPWISGHAGTGASVNAGAGAASSGHGLHFESLLLGLSLGLFLGVIGRYHWADIPRRIVTWFLIRERQFFYYTLVAGCIAVLVFY